MVINKTIIPLLALSLFACEAPKEKVEENKTVAIMAAADTVALFGENLISTPLYERDLAIAPNGESLLYTLGDYKQKRRALIHLHQVDGAWDHPEVLNISGQYQDIEPFFTPDGNRLYFASDRPIDGDTTRKDYNIWYSNKTEDTWSEPIPLDSTINTKGNEFFPSLSENGNLYFTATRQDGIGREDIFMAESIDGKLQAPKVLPEEINTVLFEFNAYVSPKEDYLIFSSFGREDGLGGGDLYISEKDSEGNWSPARNLGKEINSNKLDYCPFVDSQSQNFYFTSERSSEHTDTLTNVQDIRALADKIENGFGNIYMVSFQALEVGKK